MSLQPLDPAEARSLFTALSLTHGKEWSVAEYAQAQAHYAKCEAEYETARKTIPYDRIIADSAWDALRRAESDLIAAS